MSSSRRIGRPCYRYFRISCFRNRFQWPGWTVSRLYSVDWNFRGTCYSQMEARLVCRDDAFYESSLHVI